MGLDCIDLAYRLHTVISVFFYLLGFGNAASTVVPSAGGLTTGFGTTFSQQPPTG